MDIIERLPTPFGLVRSGVAPDHADTKSVVNRFGAILADPRVGFLGNVTLGRDITYGRDEQMSMSPANPYDVI